MRAVCSASSKCEIRGLTAPASYVELARKYGDRLIFKSCGLVESNTTLQIHYNEEQPELSTFADESIEIGYLKTTLDRTANVEIKTLDRVFLKSSRSDFEVG